MFNVQVGAFGMECVRFNISVGEVGWLINRPRTLLMAKAVMMSDSLWMMRAFPTAELESVSICKATHIINPLTCCIGLTTSPTHVLVKVHVKDADDLLHWSYNLTNTSPT